MVVQSASSKKVGCFCDILCRNYWLKLYFICPWFKEEIIVCTPFPFCVYLGGGVGEPPTKFSKRDSLIEPLEGGGGGGAW